MPEQNAEARLQILDACGDPVALDILDHLDVDGPLTSEQLGARIEGGGGPLEWYLQRLEKVGFVRQENGEWVGTPGRIDLDERDDDTREYRTALARAQWAVVQRAATLMLDWEDVRHTPRWACWSQGSTFRDYVLPPMTPAQLEDLRDRLAATVAEFRAEIGDGTDGGEPTYVLMTGFPMRGRPDPKAGF